VYWIEKAVLSKTAAAKHVSKMSYRKQYGSSSIEIIKYYLLNGQLPWYAASRTQIY
jgi:hypothetical protein